MASLRATVERPARSAFKPFVYLAALEKGFAPDDVVLDAPLRIGKWAPDNYESKYYGAVTLREALARSLNGATIRVQEGTGRSSVRRVARAMGFQSAMAPGPALGLGVNAVSPIELAGAYAPFANGGFRIAPYAIDSIETAEGDVVYRRPGSYLEQAASRASIDATNEMLRGVVEWGTGRAAAVPGYDAAGKTGTSQNSRDAWFAGHAGGLVCVVWVGRDDKCADAGRDRRAFAGSGLAGSDGARLAASICGAGDSAACGSDCGTSQARGLGLFVRRIIPENLPLKASDGVGRRG